jgi:hypothetical protein
MLTFGRVATVFCLLVPLTLSASSARADDPVKSNFEIMRTLVTEVSEELVSSFPSETPTRELLLTPVARDERYEFIANIMTKSLTTRGYRAYEPAPPNPADSTGSPAVPPAAMGESGLRLEFQVIDFSLRYPKIYRSFLIGGKKVKRSADVRVLVKLVDAADGLVVWMGESSRSYDDGFSYGAIEEVEAGLYQFTKPPRESRKWGRIIEPVVVSGIIVGLIYLFFSNQSD